MKQQFDQLPVLANVKFNFKDDVMFIGKAAYETQRPLHYRKQKLLHNDYDKRKINEPLAVLTELLLALS